MKVKVYGVNVWGPENRKKVLGSKCVFLHRDLKNHERPTPSSTMDIEGNQLYSRLRSNYLAEARIKNGEVELIKGDYTMMLPQKDIEEHGVQACGHMHYFDGEKLVSVYTNEEYEDEPAYIKRKKLENLEKLKNRKDKNVTDIINESKGE